VGWFRFHCHQQSRNNNKNKNEEISDVVYCCCGAVNFRLCDAAAVEDNDHALVCSLSLTERVDTQWKGAPFFWRRSDQSRKLESEKNKKQKGNCAALQISTK